MSEKKEKELIEIPGFDPKYNRHFTIPIIYHDENFIIVNKPYDLRIDGNTSETQTEESLILSKYPEYKGKLKLIHQLDYSTSGIHCWALNKNAARKSTKSFGQHRVKKTYVAVVRGFIEKDNFEIVKPIAKDPNSERRMMIGTPENPGKEAKTLVEVVKRGIFHPILCEPSEMNVKEDSEEKKEQQSSKDLAMEATLVKLYPYTGRTHQLRVHLSSIGHPIIGDYNYEVPFTDHERMMLHAWKINMPLDTPKNKIKNKNKKIKIGHGPEEGIPVIQDQEDSNSQASERISFGNNKNDLDDIILETENPFENLLTDI